MGVEHTNAHESPKSHDKEASSLASFTCEQDEKLLKLASELLLSDEDSLKSLSAQLLNEAKHLTQLNCVLSTLNKIRAKYLKQAANGCLEYLSNAAAAADATESTRAIESSESSSPGATNDSGNVNYILEGATSFNKCLTRIYIHVFIRIFCFCFV